MNIPFLLPRLAFFGILLLGAVSVQADDRDPIRIHSVRVGVEGFYKNGLWTPVDIDCSFQGSTENAVWTIAVSCTDSDGTPITYRNAVSVSRVQMPHFKPRIYVKLGRKDAPITVDLAVEGLGSAKKTVRPSGDPIKERQRQTEEKSDRFYAPVSSDRPIYLIVGNENIGLQGAIAELSLKEERRPLLVKVKSFADLPDQWFGYEAIDTVVLATTEPQQFEGMTAKSPQIQALDRWVKLGGRLLFLPGRNSEPFLKPEDGALRPFLPGKFTDMTDIRQGTPVELFVASKRQIFMNGTTDAPFLRVPDFSEPRGITEVKDGDLPLVLRCAHGLGTIIYFGGDLSEKPLRDWRDRVTLVRAIMKWDSERSTIGQRTGALIQLGYNDISGQIRSALDQFDGVRILPFSMILIVLAGYWLVIGPFDWFLVQKVFKRPVLTWITFPMWIVLFCALCYFGFAAPNRPNRVMLNELDLVDYDTETQSLRLSSWGNLYSPNDARYTLNMNAFCGPGFFPTQCQRQPVLFSWNGLPGSGLGGMAPKTVSPTVWQTGSEQKQGRRVPYLGIKDVPVAVRSTKSFFGQCWTGDREFDHLGCTFELKGMEGVPVGTLHWPDTMPPLDNVQLVYNRWVQDLGTLEPGQTIEVGKATARREIRDLLLPKDALEDVAVRRVASYNPQSTDLDYIVRVLTFHGAVGGVESVGVSNAFQRSLDMSDLLRLDRTILIGTVRNGEEAAFGSAITAGPTDLSDRYAGRRTVVFRQSIPIRDVAQRAELRYDPKLGPKEPEDDKTKGPDTYNPGFDK